jgi:hypothetical protein
VYSRCHSPNAARFSSSVPAELTARGEKWCILAIETEITDELIESGFNGVLQSSLPE